MFSDIAHRDVIVTSRLRLSLRGNGLFSLVFDDREVINRGGLHEFVNLAHWRDRKSIVDGQPSIEGSTRNSSDDYRDAYHFLQYYNEPSITFDNNRCTIEGVLSTSQGREGGMKYATKISVINECILKVSVVRRYLETYPHVGDDSLCFLSPAGFAKRFLLRTDTQGYATRDDGEQWKELPPHVSEPISTKIPIRIKGSVGNNAYAVTMGDDIGYGIIIVRSSENQGQLRCTRPRPPAEEKFDEIEYQWKMGGRRDSGETQSGDFYIAGCVRPSEIDQIWKALIP